MAKGKKVVDDINEEIKELLAIDIDKNTENDKNISVIVKENEDNTEEMNNQIREEPKHFEIIEKIKNLEKYFNEIDEYFDNISSYQSQNDEYISDLLHYVEVHEFTQASALKFINLLKEKRLRRRTLNNDYEIKRVFDSGRNRFVMHNSREMSMTSLYKKEKELSHPYNPRQVSFDEINQLIECKRGRKAKSEEKEEICV